MRETEILELMRANPDSYIERTAGVYRLMKASGECLGDQELWYEHVDALLDVGHIVHQGRNRYVIAR
jgi:hypothetical protein